MTTNFVTVEQAIDGIPDGSRVVASPCCGTPTTLVNALATRGDGRQLTLLLTGLLRGLGVETGVDLVAVAETSDWLDAFLGRPSPSRSARAIAARRG